MEKRTSLRREWLRKFHGVWSRGNYLRETNSLLNYQSSPVKPFTYSFARVFNANINISSGSNGVAQMCKAHTAGPDCLNSFLSWHWIFALA